jgi:hypothetical protein
MTRRKFYIRITFEFFVLATDVETIASTPNQTPPVQQESLVVSVVKSIPTNAIFPLCKLHKLLSGAWHACRLVSLGSTIRILVIASGVNK